MQLLRGIDDPSLPRGCPLSIGNFDGVHRGHVVLLERLVRRAAEIDSPSVVLTFDPRPARLLAPDRCPPQLTTPDQKAKLIAVHGVDVVIVYPTDRRLLELSPQEFFDQIVVERLQASGMVEGPNFHFGKSRTGDIALLGELCGERGMSLDVVKPARVDGIVVSSSRIRQALAEGRVEQANLMLGRAYQLTGQVGVGAGRGRSLGFPTANLVGVQTMLPADGVYAGRCHIDGGTYPAAVHLGPNPTFTDGDRKLEVHLVGFRGDLYGRAVTVDLICRLRDVRRFEGEQEIRDQIAQDVAAANALVTEIAR